MNAVSTSHPARLFKNPFEKPDSGDRPDAVDQSRDQHSEPDVEKFIFCRQCFHIITNESERIDVNGGHQHTFANPMGLVFEIGCFRTAVGCRHMGKPTADFSWFSGFKWRLAVCSKCLSQVGWLFTSLGGDGFHGLILDRLVFPG